MIPVTVNTLRQRHSPADKDPELTQQQLRRLSQTAAEILADSMFSTSTAINDNYNPTTLNSSRLSNFQQQQQQQQRSHNSFDTYPPKRNGLYTLMQKKASSSHSLQQNTKTSTSTMSARNSPLRVTNTGRYYTKRAKTKRSFSESSAERQLHKKYTSSDSSQEEDELMMNLTSAEKCKMTRKSFNNGLQSGGHKYRSLQSSAPNGMPEDDRASCTIFGKSSQHISDIIDIAIRVVLVIVFSKLETQTAFKRVIHSEELWLYKNPRTEDYVSPLSLIFAVIFGPFGITLIHLMLTKDRRDFRAASWAWTLCLGLNGLVTSLLKIIVGRPRPDYFYRCFPDGIMHLLPNATGTDNILDLFNCTGSFHDINEGRKSFPSGHSSFAFAAFGFITYYVGSKLHAFNRRGRGETWRLFVAVTPLVMAALIAVSRTCDYHHHWEDVSVGSIIGLLVSYYVYRQYYPSIFSSDCHRPYRRSVHHQVKVLAAEPLPSTRHRRRLHSYKRLPSEECGEASLLCEGHHGDDGSFTNDTEKRTLVHDQ